MARAVQNREKGGAKLNLVITLAILGAMGFAGVKIVPVYFANYQMQDSMNSESRFALTGYPKKGPSDVQDDIFKKAQDLGIPAKRDDIVVQMENGSVSIAMDYTVPIDLVVYQFTLQFHPHADNHSI
jgi:hypothetical protein